MVVAAKDRKKKKEPVTSEILDRQPPINLEAERGVLGSILLSPNACDDVTPIVKPVDFYDDANRKIFETVSGMHAEGVRVDSTLLVERLRTACLFEAIGGMAYLAQLVKSVPNASHAVYYANIVREKAATRALIDASTETLRDSYDDAVPPETKISDAEARIYSIRDSRSVSRVVSATSLMQQALEVVESRQAGTSPSGVMTGFSDLDQMLSGMRAGELLILAARPAMGKSACAMQIARNAAIDSGETVLFVSLEMSSIELGDRLLCLESMVDGHRLKNGTLSQEGRSEVVAAASRISTSGLHVEDSPSVRVSDIAASARRLARNSHSGKIGLIVVDYLQLVTPDNDKDVRQEQVAKMSRRLKGVARELECPVLCLAQLNRQTEQTTDNRPKLSHLRESGAIEQDSDVVMFVHRPEYYERDPDKLAALAGKAEIIIAKQRNGPVGTVNLMWRKNCMRFENAAPDHLADTHDNYTADFDAFNNQGAL